MKKVFLGMLLFICVTAKAQFSKASLQASGLTCSMCSKAVKNALEKVSFVDKVQVDIKNQQYNLTFLATDSIHFDALSKAVEDAGFSVASLKVTATVSNLTAAKDEHVRIGEHNFHFLNTNGEHLNGDIQFSLVDKTFVLPKDFKNYVTLSKMACVQSGRMAACCEKEHTGSNTRVYHVII